MKIKKKLSIEYGINSEVGYSNIHIVSEGIDYYLQSTDSSIICNIEKGVVKLYKKPILKNNDKNKSKPSKKVIEWLKLLYPKYKWITKGEDGGIWIHTARPILKGLDYWTSGEDEHFVFQELPQFDVDFLSWEDEEPTNIQKLIEEYEND